MTEAISVVLQVRQAALHGASLIHANVKRRGQA